MKENIFSNFYTKVLNFFTSGKTDEESSRNTASNRLKLVLMQDRSNLDGATMQKMREQLITVISKYIEIDTEALDLNLEGDGDEIALMLNIPVIRARTPEEIAEIEAQEEVAKNEEESEHSDDDTDSEESCNDSEVNNDSENTGDSNEEIDKENAETENTEECDSDNESQENQDNNN